MTVYLSGPISLGGTLDAAAIKWNMRRFEAAELELIERGLTVLNPIALPRQSTWQGYMKLAIPQVCAADVVLLLPGWERSVGAVAEIQVATWAGIRIVQTLAEV